jgi:hypothetical protein
MPAFFEREFPTARSILVGDSFPALGGREATLYTHHCQAESYPVVQSVHSGAERHWKLLPSLTLLPNTH